MENNMPIGWRQVKLGDVISLHYGKALKKADRNGGTIPVYGSNGVVGWHNDAFVQGPTVILGRKGSVGETNYSETDAWVIDTAYFIEISKPTELDLDYYYKYSKTIDISLISQKGVKPGVNRNDYLALTIPLPPLPEQKRIVAKLDVLFERIDRAMALVEENIRHAEALMDSVLWEVFEEMKDNVETVNLSTIATVARGKSKHRPRNDPKLFDGQHPFVQTGDVRGAHKYINAYKKTYNEVGLAQSKLWAKGTICLTIAANIGDVAILNMNACFPDSVVGIQPVESCTSEYLYYYLKTLQADLDSKANQAAQKNINLSILNEVSVPIPSSKIQESLAIQFSAVESSAQSIIEAKNAKLQSMNQLKTSLLDQAFKGQL